MERGWAAGGFKAVVIYKVSEGGKARTLEVERTENGWALRLDAREIKLDVERISPDTLSIIREGESFTVRRTPNGEMVVGRRPYEVSIRDPRSWRERQQASRKTEGAENLSSSMPGKVVRLLAREGDKVLANQGVLVVEAMKMQNEIRSPKAGILKRLRAAPGMTVNAGEVLAVVE